MEDPAAAALFRDVLSRQGVAIIPCDTIYGLVGGVPESEERIRLIKGRGEDKPFLILIPDPGRCPDFSPMPVPVELSGFWPGPLTLILPRQGGGTVALRVPDSPFLRGSMRSTGAALFSTSVNRTGCPPLWRERDIIGEFRDDVDLILTAGDLEGRMPSTIVDACLRPFRLVRKGALELPAGLLE